MLIDRTWLAGGAERRNGPRCARAWPLARPVFPLEGRDVLALGEPEGPRVGALLREVRQWWLDGGCVADARRAGRNWCGGCRPQARENLVGAGESMSENWNCAHPLASHGASGIAARMDAATPAIALDVVTEESSGSAASPVAGAYPPPEGPPGCVILLTLLMAGTTALYPVVIDHAFQMFTNRDQRILYQIPASGCSRHRGKGRAQYFQNVQVQQVVLLVIRGLQGRMFPHLCAPISPAWSARHRRFSPRASPPTPR